MTRRLLAFAALVIAFGAFFFSDPPAPANRAPASMGLIKHRGQFYRFEDLMNPDYRAASNDPFVQSFAPPGQYAADPWAGLDRPNFSRDEQAVRDATARPHFRRVLSIEEVRELQQRGSLPWAGAHSSTTD